MPSRRRTLAAVGGALAATGLSGCLFGVANRCGSGLSFSMDGPLSDADVAARESETPADLGPVASDLVQTAEERGSATYTSSQSPPVDDGAVVHSDSAYERVTVDERGSETVTGYRYEVSTNDSVRSAATPAETVAFDDLPAADQRMFSSAFGGKSRGVRDHKIAGASVHVTFAYANGTERNASAFVPNFARQYVRYGENVFRVARVGEADVRVTTYRITLSTVAESTAAYATAVKDGQGRHVDPSSLSADAQSFVRAAIRGDNEDVCDPLPDHVKEVLRAFGLGEAGDYRSRLVQYGDSWYDASYAEFAA